jgi:hypothetical protein
MKCLTWEEISQENGYQITSDDETVIMICSRIWQGKDFEIEDILWNLITLTRKEKVHDTNWKPENVTYTSSLEKGSRGEFFKDALEQVLLPKIGKTLQDRATGVLQDCSFARTVINISATIYQSRPLV